MLLGSPTRHPTFPHLHSHANGLTMATHIIRQEGILGLYRGFFVSLATYTPHTAIWWSCYSGYKNIYGRWANDWVKARGGGGTQTE